MDQKNSANNNGNVKELSDVIKTHLLEKFGPNVTIADETFEFLVDKRVDPAIYFKSILKSNKHI